MTENDLREFPTDTLLTPNMATLFAKIAAVMGEINPVKETGKHQQGYAYATYSDIVNDIRKSMAAHKLALIPIMREIERAAIPGKNNGTRIVGHFDFVLACGDTGETFVTHWQAEVDSYGDKGINAVATVAEKYFLMRTFLVTSADDIDETDGTEDQTKKSRSNSKPLPKQEPTPPAHTEPRNSDAWNMTELVSATKHLYANDHEQMNSLKKHTGGDTPLIGNITTGAAVELLTRYKTKQRFDKENAVISKDDLDKFIVDALDMSLSDWRKADKSMVEAWSIIQEALALRFPVENEDVPF